MATCCSAQFNKSKIASKMTSYLLSFPSIQLIGSQHITFHNVGAESVLQGHRLLFSEKGVCEIRGISTSVLIDVRYNHLTQPTSIPRSFAQYLFDTVHVAFHRPFHPQSAEEARQVYKEFNQLVRKCLEISYNSTAALIHHVHADFSPRGDDDDEYLPDLYPPPIFPPSFTHCFSFPPLPTHSQRTHAGRNRTAVSSWYPRGNMLTSPSPFRRYSAVARVTVPRDFDYR